jgi:hypothetical protein
MLSTWHTFGCRNCLIIIDNIDNYLSIHEEFMTKEEMKAEVIKAIQTGEFSRNQINPESKGKYAGYLEKGQPLSDKKVQEMYDMLCTLRKSPVPIEKKFESPTQRQKPERKRDTFVEVLPQLQTLCDRVALLEAENLVLKEKMAELGNKLDSMLSSRIDNRVDIIDNRHKGKNILGFTLNMRKTGGDQFYWYAVKRVNDKMASIYIGRDLSQAEAKIRAWLEKNPGV